MARPLRIEYEGAVYHITSRGNAREAIYQDDRDRETFLSVLDSAVKRYNWICHGYTLMTNHYHLLIETPESNLSSGMRYLNGVYTQRYNKIHFHQGHIFQGRYKAILVDKDNYLLELCRYIALNPVRAGIVDSPEKWKWSSYRAVIGKTIQPDYLTIDWILGMFDRDRSIAMKMFNGFVLNAIKGGSPWENVRGQVFLGEEKFIDRLKNMVEAKGKIKEIPREQRHVSRPILSDMFNNEKLRTKKDRNKTIYEANIKYGYKLKEVADYLGIHYTTVSKALKQIESQPKK